MPPWSRQTTGAAELDRQDDEQEAGVTDEAAGGTPGPKVEDTEAPPF